MTSDEKIKHLHWRAGFGLTPQAWESQKNETILSSWEQLRGEAMSFQPAPATSPNTAEPVNPREMTAEQRSASKKKDRQLVFQLNHEWIHQMADTTSSPLLERVALFWHGHFACISRSGLLAFNQLNTLRQYGLSNFRDLTLAIARDASMIRFLNNQQNKKEQPNENFARELMELFTIGRGHYSERDVKEAARAFTGWSSNFRGEFVFRKFQHDNGDKSFLGRTGNFNGDDIIDMLLERKETAHFVAAKAYRYFVSDQPHPERIDQLGTIFYESNYDTPTLLDSIFTSDWFYTPEVMGNKIKSPVELIVGMLRQSQGRILDPPALLNVQRALGQVLFRPPNVAGWTGGKSWIDHSTLLLRLHLAGLLFKAAQIDIRLREQAEEPRFGKRLQKLNAEIDLTPLQDAAEMVSSEAFLDRLSTYLLPFGVEAPKDTLLAFSSEANRVNTFVWRMMSLPEYQLC